MTTKPPKNGLHTIYHKNDQKSEEGKYKDGKKEGKWFSWDKKGQIRAEGRYKAGKKHGKWIEHDFQSKYDGNYKNDNKEGKWTEIWLGEKQEEIYYSSGEITRKIYYYNEKQKRNDINYSDQYVTWWHRNGQKLKEGHFKNKGSDGDWSHWYENSQLQSQGCYKDGIEDGKWTYWYDDGQKSSEGCYKDRRRDGQWTYWYENGQKSAKGVFTTRQYDCGTIHGEGTRKDGRPNMIPWRGEKEEQRDGKWTYWHANGLKAAEGYYGGDNAMSGGNLSKDISGKWPYGDAYSAVIPINRKFGHQKTGKWTYWHPNGIKAREEEWAYIHQGRRAGPHGRDIEIEQRVGRIYSWHSNGQMSLKGYYDEDGYKIGDWIRWFPNGHRKSESTYDDNPMFLQGRFNPLISITLWSDTYEKLRAHFYNKSREGQWTITRPNGNLEFFVNYVNFSDFFSKNVGPKKPEVKFKTSLEGVQKHYYENGEISDIHHYHLNKRHGLSTSFHPNGQKQSEIMFKNGESDGKRSAWDSSGKKILKNPRSLSWFSAERFDDYWIDKSRWQTIEEAIESHFNEDEDVTYVELESSLSVIDQREEEERRQRYSGISSSRSSVDEDGLSWLDKQALTDDEKLLGESFWKDIL